MGQDIQKGGSMKSIPITEFKKMLVEDIRKGGSFRLTADGELLAIVMLPTSGEKRTQLEALGSQMNAAIGK